MTRIAAEEPARPAWSGDRLNAVAVRLERDHRLDLAAVFDVELGGVDQDTATALTEAAHQPLLQGHPRHHPRHQHHRRVPPARIGRSRGARINRLIVWTWP
ncbi:hypothetical protein [Streptomyces sp. NPDC001978]|uniref:hypothetical protein n=1 Tax=Streptomyces sp. NPDC001978 TaxID=3364627 RepID=UPI003688C9F8